MGKTNSIDVMRIGLPFAVGLLFLSGWLLISGQRTVPFTGYETDGVYYMFQARALFTNSFAPSTYGGGIGMPSAIFLLNRFISDTFLAAKVVSGLAGLILDFCDVKDKRSLDSLFQWSAGAPTQSR